MANFRDKSVIVTGSSSGIGEAAALMFAGKGANMTVCGRDELRLREIVEACLKAGQEAGHSNRVITVSGDLSSADVRAETIDKTVEAFGKLDILVVNHGAYHAARGMNDVTEEIFDSIIDKNVKSVLFLIKQAVPHLEKTGGSVVVTSSIASTLSTVGNIAYNISKAAVDHMMRNLALELGPKGIRINATNPTYTKTRIFRDLPPAFLNGRSFKAVSEGHPLHGRHSNPEEQAEVILFLASDAARDSAGIPLVSAGHRKRLTRTCPERVL
ncbi:hypothetical protein EGW08_007657 [Elysia chlorotica]|uniref:Uncharacterized protein n=1 Tax=Elysia chlorotica TaxID=188477 RepID=A0A3S1BMZ8_ELYCH|nr:hypothetical protein EGW08_007657 [Elysia chlorotica]